VGAPWERRHPCLLAFETRPFFFKPPTLQDMQVGMPALKGMAPHLPFTQSQPLRTLILRRIGIVSAKVWLLRRWRLAQGF
jgi:hypothetical protein